MSDHREMRPCPKCGKEYDLTYPEKWSFVCSCGSFLLVQVEALGEETLIYLEENTP